MKHTYMVLLGIVVASLLFRLALLPMIQNPGLNDQNHYYNLGTRLLNGDGLTIDYVWHYSHLPDDIVHPIDHWMPLAGVAVAGGMSIAGETPQGALLFFIVAGALLPIVVFFAGKQFGLRDDSALIASAFVISLPDIVWNSLRTDSTILNMLFISASVVLFLYAVRHTKLWAYAISGALGGIAYLTRNDSIVMLPLILGCTLTYALWGAKFTVRQQLWKVAVFFVAFFIVISPWMLRNYQLLGSFGSPETDRMFFMLDTKEHYAYNIPITLERMLEERTPQDLIAKRLFELAAAFKQMMISLDVVLPMLVGVGGLYVLWERDQERLLVSTPTILWIVGILVAYPFLLPYKSQSGSFEKAYLTILPLLMPFAALVLEKLVTEARWRYIIAGVSVLVMGANSFDVLRTETQFANEYYALIADMVASIETLPDMTDDGDLRFMTQDPYVLSYFGHPSVMIPFTTTRDDVLEIVALYDIDYLIMPSARPVLDPLYLQEEADPRFPFVMAISRPARTDYEIYSFNISDDDNDN